MNTKNTLIWLILVILMILNFWLAEYSPIISKWTLQIILLVIIIKFLTVIFQFMDLKEAHKNWKYIFIIFVFTYAGVISLV